MELIIASVVVTVVMLGVVSASIILQKNSTDYTNRYFVTQTATNVLNSILADASQVVGTVNCPGIVIGINSTGTGGCALSSGTGDANTICFYQDMNGAGIGNGTIQDTTYGQWACYTYSANNIYRCTSNYNNGGNQGMNQCNAGAGSTLVGTASALPWPSASFNTGVFSLTVDNCWNPAIASCCNPINTNCSSDSSNPFAEKKGSVSAGSYSAS